MHQRLPQAELTCQRKEFAFALSEVRNLTSTIDDGLIPHYVSLTLSEALVLGLWRQDDMHFFRLLGHDSTK
jgi:hypothetical protein